MKAYIQTGIRAYKSAGINILGTFLNQSLTAVLEATGTGAGVSTLRLEVSETQTITLDGGARFYTDAGGTAGESTTWEVTIGELRTIYLRCPSGTSKMVIPKKDKVIKWGNNSIDGWTSSTDAAKITIEVGKLALTMLRITGISTLTGALPTGLTFLYLYGNLINWTYSGALPTGLTYVYLSGNQLNWTYSGALPTGLTYLYLYGNLINWTYSGALPTGLTYVYLSGNQLNWTYSGALPTELTFLRLSGNQLNWTYSGALPTGLSILNLSGSLLNWTYSGALPTELTFLYLNGSLINWTYSGALPTGLTYLRLIGSLLNWTYSGALPTGLTYLSLYGNLLNWTYNQITGTANFVNFSLLNYRDTKMSSADMVILLDSLRTKTGTFPATVTINDYADYASPPVEVVAAVDALKTAKSITTVNLGA